MRFQSVNFPLHEWNNKKTFNTPHKAHGAKNPAKQISLQQKLNAAIAQTKRDCTIVLRVFCASDWRGYVNNSPLQYFVTIDSWP